jgi:hypothetical protein
MRSYLLTALFLLYFALFPSSIGAMGFEQHLLITSTQYQTTQSADPTDNSLGIILWDDDVFTSPTVYFEAVIRCSACEGGNAQATATLYTVGGTAVTNGAVSTQNTTATRARTANITSNLTDDEEYTVRLTLDATTGTAILESARLIIVQSNATLTTTQTAIELGQITTTSNTAFTLTPHPKFFYNQSSRYSPAPTITFEAVLKSSDPNSSADAALSTSSTCASTVANSAVSVIGTTYDRVRSSSLSLSDATTYYVCFKSSDGAQTASLTNAKILLNQTHSGGLSRVQTYLPLITDVQAVTGNTFTDVLSPIDFTPGNFSGAAINFYHDAIIKTSASTAQSRLYSVADTVAVDNSTAQTTQTGYSLNRSSEITSDLPSSSGNLIPQLVNSSTDTTTASASWLVAAIHAYPSLSFAIEGVTANTTTNSMITTKASAIDELDFGSLSVSTPSYIAHRLTTSTSAASGYTVSIKLLNTMQGNYPANIIESFPATWNSPQTWTEPTGTAPNINSGWIGANTSDTRVSGWSDGANKFGPLGTTNQIVMQSTGPDAGTSAYVTYALEVNQYQPTDTYSGILVYNITPTY